MPAWSRLLALVIAVGIPSLAAAGELTVVNSSGKPVEELYLVMSGQRSWARTTCAASSRA
jgi:ABC-type amino acid transport system permease subunit